MEQMLHPFLDSLQVKNTTMHSCTQILPLFIKAKASMDALREVFGDGVIIVLVVCGQHALFAH
jgi:hypothetical protein